MNMDTVFNFNWLPRVRFGCLLTYICSLMMERLVCTRWILKAVHMNAKIRRGLVFYLADKSGRYYLGRHRDLSSRGNDECDLLGSCQELRLLPLVFNSRERWSKRLVMIHYVVKDIAIWTKNNKQILTQFPKPLPSPSNEKRKKSAT